MTKKKVSQFVHDRDNKTRDIWASQVPDASEKIDPNHGKKWFPYYWDRLINGAYRKARNLIEYCISALLFFTLIEYKKKFYGLKTHINDWFINLLYDKKMDAATKKAKWLNIGNHVLGKHDFCNHGQVKCFEWKNGINNSKLAEDFHDFLVETQSIFDKVDPTLNTNANESLHASTARIADKNTPWSKDGYEGRVYYSYLKHNKPYECAYLIRERCKAKTNKVDLKKFESNIIEKKKLEEKQSSVEYQFNARYSKAK